MLVYQQSALQQSGSDVLVPAEPGSRVVLVEVLETGGGPPVEQISRWPLLVWRARIYPHAPKGATCGPLWPVIPLCALECLDESWNSPAWLYSVLCVTVPGGLGYLYRPDDGSLDVLSGGGSDTDLLAACHAAARDTEEPGYLEYMEGVTD